jgi:hypothetical protein
MAAAVCFGFPQRFVGCKLDSQGGSVQRAVRDWMSGACCVQIEEATLISADRLESQLHKVKQTIDDDKDKGQETPYALIIDGKALLYALSPRLRQLFLEVGAPDCACHPAAGQLQST